MKDPSFWNILKSAKPVIMCSKTSFLWSLETLTVCWTFLKFKCSWKYFPYIKKNSRKLTLQILHRSQKCIFLEQKSLFFFSLGEERVGFFRRRIWKVFLGIRTADQSLSYRNGGRAVVPNTRWRNPLMSICKQNQHSSSVDDVEVHALTVNLNIRLLRLRSHETTDKVVVGTFKSHDLWRTLKKKRKKVKYLYIRSLLVTLIFWQTKHLGQMKNQQSFSMLFFLQRTWPSDTSCRFALPYRATAKLKRVIFRFWAVRINADINQQPLGSSWWALHQFKKAFEDFIWCVHRRDCTLINGSRPEMNVWEWIG